MYLKSLDFNSIDQYGNVTLSAGMTQDVRLLDLNLTHCTDYSVRVVAIMGVEFSDEEEVVFNTCHISRNNETLEHFTEEGPECVKMEEECVDMSIRDDNCDSDGVCVSATVSHHLYLQNVIFYLLVFICWS